MVLFHGEMVRLLSSELECIHLIKLVVSIDLLFLTTDGIFESQVGMKLLLAGGFGLNRKRWGQAKGVVDFDRSSRKFCVLDLDGGHAKVLAVLVSGNRRVHIVADHLV